MGSLLMHVCVSNIVKEKLNLTNKFLVGTVMPDLIKLEKDERTKSHYLKKFVYNNGVKELPDINKFITDNKDNLNDEEKLGYLAHLIEDRIWFEKYIPKYIKCMNNNENLVICLKNGCFKDAKQFTNELYSDYMKIGDYIIDKYNINSKKIREDLFYYLKKDIYREIVNKYILDKQYINDKEMFFFTTQDINYYIKESVNEVLKILSEILGE